MKALLGLIEPTYGEIEVMGVDMREHPEDVYRVMGFMPDFPPVYEDLYGLGVPRSLCRQLRHSAGEAARSEVDRYLEMVGLSEKRKSLVVELSRGMRQRLMLAKTLMPDPRVLLAGRAGQRRRSARANRAEEHPAAAGRREADGADLVAHPDRDGRVLHVGRDHGAAAGWWSAAGSTKSTSGSWATA